MTALVLGPLLRHVDATTAAVWVETREAAIVEVRAGEHTGEARTFGVHGRHYALVELAGLTPGTRTPYEVRVSGEVVWPEPDSAFPPSQITTLTEGRAPALAFGSCRVSVGHDDDSTEQFGVDAMRAYALHLAAEPDAPRPDLLVLLGDQVYADETTEAMREFIASRRSLDEPPGEEIKDYLEYTHLYQTAWCDPANRWLLSTVSSAMIFDDHDIRDDWNTSWTWREEMAATSWWHDRIVGGLASYWVYQHLGNLGPRERAADPIWKRIVGHDGPEELDLTEELDAFAERADRQPDCYRWSFARDFGDQVRLVVVDSRAARVLEPEQRSIIDPAEMSWLDEQMQGGVDHLIIGTSLPFLLAPALHHAEAFSEGLCNGAWGRALTGVGERLRQAIDLEHWAAFGQGFRQVADLTLAVASGRRGPAPRSVLFLSGDVHHSYVSSARPDPQVTDAEVTSQIVQAVCSPIRNPLPKGMQRVFTWGARRRLGTTVAALARSAKVPPSPLTWQVDRGPWYDNNLALLDLGEDSVQLTWVAGDISGRASDQPLLRTVSRVSVSAQGVR